jgi:hypothetical protein
MAQSHRPRLWLLPALAVVLIAVGVLLLRGALPHGGSHSPLPTPSAPGTSPLPTPIPTNTAATPPPAWTGSGTALAWVALGIGLALVVAFLILLRHRPTA